MNEQPWIKLPVPPMSDTKLITRSEVMRVFRALSRVDLHVTDGDGSETPNGLAIRPHSTPQAFIPGLTVSYVKSGTMWIAVEPCLINGLMPEINGTPLDADTPPLLPFMGAGTIVVAFDVNATIPDRFYPSVSTSNVEIGYDSAFTAAEPEITWDSNIHDNDPPNPAGDDPSPPVITNGKWLTPIATILSSGRIIQHLKCETFPATIDLNITTSNW